jgi:hypothetical protein
MCIQLLDSPGTNSSQVAVVASQMSEQCNSNDRATYFSLSSSVTGLFQEFQKNFQAETLKVF